MTTTFSPEEWLTASDEILAGVIAVVPTRWPSFPTEEAIGGLMRIVMAQQVSTLVACRLVGKARTIYPHLLNPSPSKAVDAVDFRKLGLSQRRAKCCSEILLRSDELRSKVKAGLSWDQALTGFKGIGPWTIAVFKIMVLRQPDVLPLGDVGLKRAIENIYGAGQDVEKLSEKWRPFRSVACWYLWRTLGNQQLG